MVANSERIENLWSKPESNEAQRGPLYTVRTQLAGAFEQVTGLSGLPKDVEKQGDSIISPIVSLKSDETPYFPLHTKDSYTFSAKARKTGTDDIFVAIQEKPKNKNDLVDSEIYEYIINSNGSVVRKDELDSKIDTLGLSTDEIAFVKGATHLLTDSLHRSISTFNTIRNRELREKQYRKARIAKKLGWTAGSVASVAGLVAGGYFAWSAWIDEPGKAEDARREAYDASNKTIDGAEIELSDQTLTILPNDAFDEIPSFRNDDSLESPRTINLDSDGCAEIDVENLDGKTLKVGISQYNPIGEYSVIAYERDEKLVVCTTETPDSDIPEDDMKIAIQLADPSAR